MNSGRVLRTLSFEELEQKLHPLIYKLSHTGGRSAYASEGIPGYEVEDFEQELRLVLWKCQQSFSPETKSGYAGKASTFMNFFIHAVENKFGKLRASTDKYYRPITQLECVECQTRVPTQGRAKCLKCGGRRWSYVRGATVIALEDLLHDPAVEALDLEGAGEIISELTPELADIAVRLLSPKVLENGKEESLSAADKRALRQYGDRDDLPPELSYQKSVRARKGAY